jgi:hypothetical protein
VTDHPSLIAGPDDPEKRDLAVIWAKHGDYDASWRP